MSRLNLFNGLIFIFSFLFFSCERDTNTPLPIADFDMSISSGFVGDTIFFNNLSEEASNFEWSFGDGTMSALENPVHTYTKEGTFKVELTAINSGGTDTISKEITIEAKMLDVEKIIGAWEVTNEYKSDYISFEFNENGNYFIEKSDGYYYGYCQIIDENTIKLEGYGEITFNKLENNKLSFELISNLGNKILIDVINLQSISDSRKTSALCRVWEMTSVDNIPIQNLDIEYYIMFFSYSGKFFISYSDSYDQDSGIMYWVWKDLDEDTICYSLEENSNCDGDYLLGVEIINNELTLIEGGMLLQFRPYLYQDI